eukprot:9895995-Lingulodinium_polyedra.AAC.1
MRFVVWLITGDLDWLSNSCGYPHFNSNRPCWFDSADRGEMSTYPLTDLSKGADWKLTVLSYEDACVLCTIHPIGSIVATT